jgi:hypothetical protein
LNATGFYEEISGKGIPILSYEEFLRVTDKMVKTQRAVLFNDENWGLKDQPVQEITIPLGIDLPAYADHHDERRSALA